MEYQCKNQTSYLYLGGAITSRMARNLSLTITLSTRPTSAACFLVVTVTHLSTYYYLVLRPMFSKDPMICSTCLEIRSFAIGSFAPLIMGTNIAVLANLSSCLLNKTLRLPQFHIRAYSDWIQFFRQHAFKGMSRRYFVAYPILNGFLASMIFLGQDYYSRNYLQQRLDSLNEQPLPYKEPQKRNKVVGSVQDFFTKLFGSKTR
jgi:hypothetical protein